MIWDIIIIVLIALGTYRGFRKGAVAIIIGFVVFIAAMIIATLFGTAFGNLLTFVAQYLRPTVGFFLLFVLLLIAGGFIKRTLTPKQGMFAGLNKILGAGIEFVKTVLLLGLLFSFMRIFGLPSVDSVKTSKTYPMVLDATALIVKQIKPLVSSFKSSDVFDEMGPVDSTTTHPPQP